MTPLDRKVARVIALLAEGEMVAHNLRAVGQGGCQEVEEFYELAEEAIKQIDQPGKRA